MKNNSYFTPSFADNLGIGIFKYSLFPQEKFLNINETLVKILGYPAKNSFKNLKLGDLFINQHHRDDFFRMLRRKGSVKFFETTFKNKVEKKLWVAVTADRIDIDKKQFVEGIIEDISGHKKMEEDLSLEHSFLEGLLDTIPDAIYFKDLSNRIIKINQFYGKNIGIEPREVIGKTDFDFFPHEQAKQMFEDDNYVLTTGNPIVGKIERTLLPDGSWNQVITTKIPIYDKTGEIAGTMGITRDMTAYANHERERLAMLINTVKVLGKALEMRDPYTFSHTRRVANIAESIAKTLNWDENRILGIRLAGELHDLGKISIPLDILNKPGKLSIIEHNLIQEHVINCYNLIKDIEFPFPLAKVILQHHERLDGSGYPNKLKDTAILLESRVLAVSDVLEAMTHHRPYREALGLEEAYKELTTGSGSKYDPNIINVVYNLMKNNGMKIFWANGQ